MITMEANAVKKRFDDYGLRALLAHIIPFGGVSHNSLMIPGRAGGILVDQDIPPVNLEVELSMLESDKTAAVGRLNELMMFLFDEYGKAREIKLTTDYEPDKYRLGYVVGDVLSLRSAITNGLTLSFICYKAFKYSVVENDDITWGSEVLTFQSTAYTLGHESSSAAFNVKAAGTISVDVMGLALQPIITIWGKATNLVITNRGKKITVGTFENKSWEINCGSFISYLNGVETMIPMDNFVLHNGENNIEFRGTNIDIDVTIRFRDRWK